VSLFFFFYAPEDYNGAIEEPRAFVPSFEEPRKVKKKRRKIVFDVKGATPKTQVAEAQIPSLASIALADIEEKRRIEALRLAEIKNKRIEDELIARLRQEAIEEQARIAKYLRDQKIAEVKRQEQIRQELERKRLAYEARQREIEEAIARHKKFKEVMRSRTDVQKKEEEMVLMYMLGAGHI
jgi:hypothetical protein